MSPYAKAAMLVIRLVACALLLWGFGLCAPYIYLYVAASKKHESFTLPWVFAFKVLPLLAGLVLFWKSRAMAMQLTQDLD